jgi:hypothetical protein
MRKNNYARDYSPDWKIEEVSDVENEEHSSLPTHASARLEMPVDEQQTDSSGLRANDRNHSKKALVEGVTDEEDEKLGQGLDWMKSAALLESG